MRVKRVQEGWFRDTIVLIADEYEDCLIGTLMGLRTYWVEEGERARMKVPKDWCVEEGDEYDLEDLVLYQGGLSDTFSWCWGDYTDDDDED